MLDPHRLLFSLFFGSITCTSLFFSFYYDFIYFLLCYFNADLPYNFTFTNNVQIFF